MPSAAKTSLSAGNATPPPTDHSAKISDYTNRNLSRPPRTDVLAETVDKAHLCTVEPLSIKVEDGPDGTVAGFLHLPPAGDVQNQQQPQAKSPQTAAILLSGAGGGVVGPSSIYLSIANKLASLRNSALPVLRLDYRFPARNRYCVNDVLAGMDYLEQRHSVSKFVLVGWSFGGAPVFTVGGSKKGKERVVGCATVASQTAETDGIDWLSPTPVLLLHGTGDRTLSPWCSESLYEAYGTKGRREIKLFDGDDHALSRNAAVAEEMISRFVLRCAGVKVGAEERAVLGKELVGDGDRVELMKKGGDLKGAESVE